MRRPRRWPPDAGWSAPPAPSIQFAKTPVSDCRMPTIPRWQTARTFCDGLLQLVYPHICWICQQRQPELRDGVCPDCEQSITHDPHTTCPRCCSTVGPYVNLDAGCATCKDESFAF